MAKKKSEKQKISVSVEIATNSVAKAMVATEKAIPKGAEITSTYKFSDLDEKKSKKKVTVSFTVVSDSMANTIRTVEEALPKNAEVVSSYNIDSEW